MILSTRSQAQEVFSEAFLGAAPFAIETVNDELYISVWNNTDETPYGLYKLDFANPSEKILVATLDNYIGIGAFKFYNNITTNELYGFVANDHFIVDLDDNLPINATYASSPSSSTAQRGVLENSNVLYFARDNSKDIISVDRANLSNDPEVIYTSASSTDFNVLAGVNDNILYFFQKNGDTYSLLSKNLNDTSETEEVISVLSSISSDGTNLIQDAFLKNDIIYFTLNDTSVQGVYKIDSTENDANAELITSVSGDIIGITDFENNLYYVSEQKIYRIEEASLSIKENTLVPEVSIFPNPTTAELRIQLENKDISKVQVIDLLGKTVSSTTSFENSISVAQLKSGVYIILVSTADGTTYNKRFIKK